MQARTKKLHIARLEKALTRCHKAIKKLEEAEVDLDDEEDSSYIKVQRCV